MAEIEIAPLADRLGDEEIGELKNELEKIGAPRLPAAIDDGAAGKLATGIDDDVLAEFFDRLEAYDIACEIYLPAEFEGRVEIGDKRVGSAHTLLEVLEELKEELLMEEDDEDEDEDLDDDEDEEDDDEDEEEDDDDDYGDNLELIDEQLRKVWKIVYNGAQTAMERKLPLYVRST
jgi:hypothetical protein